jgi:hypothetical protein
LDDIEVEMMKGIEDEAGTRLSDVEDHSKLISRLPSQFDSDLVWVEIP